MKKFVLAAAILAFAAPSYAQLGGILSGAQKANDAKNKVDSMIITADEERQIGSDVSTKPRTRFGVVQDPAIHKYVALVGTAVAENAPADQQPKGGWAFIVLDTDGVNAFATPGGFVHVTRGALALMQNESELASVLGHEIGHVTRKHTVNAIRKSTGVKLGTEFAGNRVGLLGRLTELAYDQIIEGTFDRGDEMDSDKVSTDLASKAGYASTLDDFLTRLADRNKSMPTRNGLFASHPDTKARLDALKKLDAPIKTVALAESRYKSSVNYPLAPVTSIAVVTDGAAGLTGGGKDTKEEAKKEEPKKSSPLGLGALKKTAAPEQKTAQVQNSGGSRGVGPDRDAKGGSNPAVVRVAVTAADVAAFKRGIA